MQSSFYADYSKRVFDIIFSFLGILILSPIFFLISIFVKITSKGEIIYVQKRVGQNFIEFNLYKFRSMFKNADKGGLQVTKQDDKRITSFGKILRRTKFDELLQLFNVLKGDMSFVGPRPEVLKYVEIYKKEYQKILEIKPGITDFATIEFRYEEQLLNRYKDTEKAYIEKILPMKIELYKKYLQEITFWTDLNIIFKTLLKILIKDCSHYK